jgi:hypothetical protein
MDHLRLGHFAGLRDLAVVGARISPIILFATIVEVHEHAPRKQFWALKHSGTAWDGRNTVFTCSWSTRGYRSAGTASNLLEEEESGRLYRILPPNEISD